MKSNAGFWLVDANPFDLPEPPKWWQRSVLAHDKMLRLMPSQVDRCYRLCRVARREARVGLRLMGDLHKHPDTVAMVNFGVVPELTLTPQAVFSPTIIPLLRSRDRWLQFGGDPEKEIAALEQAEQQAEAQKKAVRDAEMDEVLTDSYRHVKYGYRATTQAERIFGDRSLLKPLPVLPAVLPRTLTTITHL